MVGLKMEIYLNSKIPEYEKKINWIDQKLTKLESKNSHKATIKQLESISKELKNDLQIYKTILASGSQEILKRALSRLKYMEYNSIILSNFFIPALELENENDIKLGSFINRMSNELGINCIEDIIVRTDRSYATFPHIAECPIFYLPPERNLLSMTALYHEFGHVIFRKEQDILDKIANFVQNYYQNSLRNLGSISPEKRQNIIQRTERTINFWINPRRINELFSDITAIYFCGSAYYFNWLDITIKTVSDPYLIDEADEHPPFAARVTICKFALEHLQLKRGKEITRIWNEYRKHVTRKDYNYDLLCPDNFLKELCSFIIEIIENRFNEYKYQESDYSAGNPKDNDLFILTLSDILNVSFNKYIERPKEYPKWEKYVLSKLEIEN